MRRDELAKRIYDVSLLRGEFLLRSGATSDKYFDKYRFESDPKLLHEIALGLRELVPSDTDYLAGLELGGIPIATMLAQLTGVPALFVRKEAKTYGTCNLVEGAPIEGKTLCIVEDVVTSGGQIRISTAELRKLGATVHTALCVIDRESGGSENLKADELELRALFRMSELGD